MSFPMDYTMELIDKNDEPMPLPPVPPAMIYVDCPENTNLSGSDPVARLHLRLLHRSISTRFFRNVATGAARSVLES